ncbi:MAG TPA: CoA pyrophosphatase [Dehalococcoidia bacterium]|nr:CoA pyrophosphatase [Dehalococcoidia bacterium]
MKTDELLERIEAALADYNPRAIDNPSTTPAAVLLLLREVEDETHVVFTARAATVKDHKGQMCFPGGGSDETDPTPEATALRETFEEIGVRSETVRIIGQLDDMVTVSNFRVTPFVGVIENGKECSYEICDDEVTRVVEVPLSFLMEDGNMELEVREHHGREVLVPAFSYNGHRIWGATARMLHQLIELVR